MIHRLLACLVLLITTSVTAHASSADVCNIPPRYGVSETAKEIVKTACEEHRLWQRPFIDRNGRLASLGPTEAENDSLADDGLIAWQRAAGYWRESNTLNAMAAIPGAQSCMAPAGLRETDNDCRSFLLDNPWSAAFISWVMTRSGVATFTRSPRHIDYIRTAYSTPASSPYQLRDPAAEKPAPGDMLCFLRNRTTSLDYTGLVHALGNNSAQHWPSHCEIVVAANVGGDRTLYLIGGNVANTVVMRMLPLGQTGLVEVPNKAAGEAIDQCTPEREQQCNFNRQDWAALLKLNAIPPTPIQLPDQTTTPPVRDDASP